MPLDRPLLRAHAPPLEHQKCKAGCGRWRQSRRSGLCRTCQKEAGIIESLNTQLRRELLEQAAAAEKMQALKVPKPVRTLEVNGREFVVVWDGSK